MVGILIWSGMTAYMPMWRRKGSAGRASWHSTVIPEYAWEFFWPFTKSGSWPSLMPNLIDLFEASTWPFRYGYAGVHLSDFSIFLCNELFAIISNDGEGYPKARDDISPNETNDVCLFDFDQGLSLNPFCIVICGGEKKFETAWGNRELANDVHTPLCKMKRTCQRTKSWRGWWRLGRTSGSFGIACHIYLSFAPSLATSSLG